MKVMSKRSPRAWLQTNSTDRRVLVLWHPAYKGHDFHTGSFKQLRDPLQQHGNRNASSASKRKGKSREGWQWFGPIHSSDEGSVMEPEQRDGT